MTSRKYAQLTCQSGNIGDDIQSLAATQHLPRLPDFYIDRETIQNRQSDDATLIMNGWFSIDAAAWPPAPTVKPVFVGFHIADRFKGSIKTHIDYLRRFEPVGVRDEVTAQFLNALGIKTEITYCLTLTFPTRERAPINGKVYVVDAGHMAMPEVMRRNSVKFTHSMAPLDYRATIPFAQKLLDTYRDNASLVVTTRLHAALPCIAMGIPVVFFGNPKDGRTNVVRDIGGKIYDVRLHNRSLISGKFGNWMDEVDWSPRPLDISTRKAALIKTLASRLDKAGA